MKRFLITGIAGGILGALVFWLYQVIFIGYTISGYIGSQVVRQGKYALSPEWVGWGVHLWVSLSYAFLLALIAVYVLPRSFALNRGLALAVALALGWIATLIAPLAIQSTISLLVGNGFPKKLAGLHHAKDHVLWNHLIFFVLVWAIDTGAALFSRSPGAEGAGS